MPNGKDMIAELEFMERIKKMPERELQEFTARETYFTRLKVDKNSNRLDVLESSAKIALGKASGIGGAVGAGIGTAIYFLINHFAK